MIFSYEFSITAIETFIMLWDGFLCTCLSLHDTDLTRQPSYLYTIFTKSNHLHHIYLSAPSSQTKTIAQKQFTGTKYHNAKGHSIITNLKIQLHYFPCSIWLEKLNIFRKLLPLPHIITLNKD